MAQPRQGLVTNLGKRDAIVHTQHLLDDEIIKSDQRIKQINGRIDSASSSDKKSLQQEMSKLQSKKANLTGAHFIQSLQKARKDFNEYSTSNVKNNEDAQLISELIDEVISDMKNLENDILNS